MSGGTRAASLVTVAYWPLDDQLPTSSGVNTMVDSTGRGNDLTRRMIPAVSTLAFALAGNSAGAQLTTGRLAKWGKWNRVLTTAEKTALLAAEGWPFSTTTSLQDAVAYYLLNEAGGSSSYADATARGNTLTKAGASATVRVAGPLGSDFATQFDGTNYLTRAATTDLQGGNATYTIAGWVKLDSLGAAGSVQAFWGQFDNANRIGNVVYYHRDNTAFQGDLGNDVDLYRNAGVVSTNAGAPTTGVWYLLLYEYNGATNTLTEEVNGTANSLSTIQQPDRVTGKIGSSPIGAKFRVNPDYRATNQSGWDLVGAEVCCTKAVNGDLSIGNTAKTVWGWVKFDDFTTTQSVMGCFNLTGTSGDWMIQQSAGVMAFVLGDSAGH